MSRAAMVQNSPVLTVFPYREQPETAGTRQIGAPVRLDDSQGRRHYALVSEPEGVAPARCGSRTEPAWHVAQTHPQAERWAATCLTEQGFPVYLPLCAVVRQDRVLRTMTRHVEVPLWPGYVLVRFAASDPWGPVQHTRGVRRLLMASDGNPGIVSNGLVEAVRATEASRRTVTPPGALWRPGAAVRLAGGAFAGTDAVVLSVSRDTAVVGLICFGQMRQAIVGLALFASRDEGMKPHG